MILHISKKNSLGQVSLPESTQMSPVLLGQRIEKRWNSELPVKYLIS